MSNNKVFGYARVSSKSQNLDRQIVAIEEYCKNNKLNIDMDRDVYKDKASGKDFNREGYQALKQCLRSGDILIIKEMDRLGRNKDEIKEELKWFKENKIIVRILDIPTTLIDFGQYGNEIAKSMMDMVNNVLIEVLGTIAEEERRKNKQRRDEGIENARRKGKHLGRPKTDYPNNWEEVYNSWKNGEITATKSMEELELKRNTFYRLVKKYEEGVK